MSETRNNNGWLLIFFFLLIGSVLVLKPVRTIFTAHSLNSHKSSVKAIEKCFDGGGDVSDIFATSGGRWSQYCNDGGKHNFWRIYECGPNGERVVVTQFKQGVRRLITYMKNHKMTPMEMEC